MSSMIAISLNLNCIRHVPSKAPTQQTLWKVNTKRDLAGVQCLLRRICDQCVNIILSKFAVRICVHNQYIFICMCVQCELIKT